MANSPVCSIPNCGKRHFGRGWCEKHYLRWRKNGDPLKCRPRRAEGEAKQWVRTIAIPFKGKECLQWPFIRGRKGYGRIYHNGKMWVASRFICEAAHGAPIPLSLHAAHNCGNPSCVNPNHLRWASPKENEADKVVHGTFHPGANFTKLTKEQVLSIRAKFETGQHLQKHLAREFNVSKSTLSQILNRRTWTQI